MCSAYQHGIASTVPCFLVSTAPNTTFSAGLGVVAGADVLVGTRIGMDSVKHGCNYCIHIYTINANKVICCHIRPP